MPRSFHLQALRQTPAYNRYNQVTLCILLLVCCIFSGQHLLGIEVGLEELETGVVEFMVG